MGPTRDERKKLANQNQSRLPRVAVFLWRRIEGHSSSLIDTSKIAGMTEERARCGTWKHTDLLLLPRIVAWRANFSLVIPAIFRRESMRGTSCAEGRSRSIRMDPGPRIAGMTEHGSRVGLRAKPALRCGARRHTASRFCTNVPSPPCVPSFPHGSGGNPSGRPASTMGLSLPCPPLRTDSA